MTEQEADHLIANAARLEGERDKLFDAYMDNPNWRTYEPYLTKLEAWRDAARALANARHNYPDLFE